MTACHACADEIERRLDTDDPFPEMRAFIASLRHDTEPAPPPDCTRETATACAALAEAGRVVEALEARHG